MTLGFLGMAGLLSGDKARVYGRVTRRGKGGASREGIISSLGLAWQYVCYHVEIAE